MSIHDNEVYPGVRRKDPKQIILPCELVQSDRTHSKDAIDECPDLHGDEEEQEDLGVREHRAPEC